MDDLNKDNEKKVMEIKDKRIYLIMSIVGIVLGVIAIIIAIIK